MATVGLYNLLFSRVFESGSAVADVVAGEAKPAEGAKQLLPPAADFSTLIQSLLAQTPIATQESKVPAVEKTPEIVETETFLSELFGREVEVQPLGQIEGFEFFQITLGAEIAETQPAETASEVESGSIAAEFLSLLFAPIENSETNQIPETETPNRVEAFLLVGRGPVKPSRVEGAAAETADSDETSFVPIFLFLFQGELPKALREGEKQPETSIKPIETKVPQIQTSGVGKTPEGLTLTLFTIPIPETRAGEKSPPQNPEKPAESTERPSLVSSEAKPKSERAVEIPTPNRSKVEVSKLGAQAETQKTSFSPREVQEPVALVEELEVNRPVDTPMRSVKENEEPTPSTQAEGQRSERSVEVLAKLEEGAIPRRAEVEFHPQFVAAIQRVVEKVSNHPLRDQVIYNEGEKLAQRNREGDWVPSVKTEAAPNGSSVKNTEEVDVSLADSSEEVVPVAQSENRKVAETMVPAPEVMTASTPAGQKVPSEEPILIPNPAKPATPTPNLIQPTEAETPKSPKPAPAPESASVEPKPSAVVERKVIQVQVLAGDMAEKLEALSGRILETRTYRGHETQNPIRPEGTNQSREISSQSNPQNGTTNQAIVVETSAKSGEVTPKLATSQNPNPVITPRADSVTPTIKLSAESPEPTNGTLISKPVSTEGKVANQETSVQNSNADNKPKIAPDAKRPVLSISEAAVDSTGNRPEPSQPDKRPVETVTRRPETVSTPVSKPTPSVVPDTQSEARVVRESLFATLTGQKESKKSEAKVTADEKAPRPEARATVAKPTSTTTASQPVTQSIAKPSIQAIVPPIELPKVAPDKSVETFNNSAEKSSPVIPVNETNSVVSRPTQTNPTPSLPPAPVEENEILNQISRNIQSRSVTQGSEMRIRLVPESLGEIHVKVMVRDGQVIAEIRASSDATREILTKNATHLQSLLAESGVGMEKVVVRTGNFGSDLQGQFTQQRDAGQQQDPKEGGRNQSNDPEGDRSQGREDSRKNPRRRAWERFV